MTALSDHAEQLLLTWMCTTSAATRPTAWHLQLHTADPGETGATGAVAGQARASFTWAAPSAGSTSNAAAINVTMTVTPSGPVTHISVWDAGSGGNCLAKGALTSARTVSSGDTFSIPTNQLTLALN